jgi:hypothetical protein
MFTRHDSIPWKMRLGPYLTHPEARKTIAVIVVAAIGIGAGVIATLPEQTTHASSLSSSTLSASSVVLPSEEKPIAAEGTVAADADCEKQAWPYINQRCADSAAYQRGTRQVRVVTDRGATMTVTTPIPIVEPKPPAPPRVAVARTEERIGPEVIPAPPEQAQEASLQQAVAQSQPPKPAEPAPHPVPQQQAATAPKPQAPAARPPLPATATQVAAGVPGPGDARDISTLAEATEIPMSKKAKAAAKAREKREAARAQREARRRNAPAPQDTAVPAEVVAAVEASTRGERARGRKPAERPVTVEQGVPAEVVAAVQAMTAADLGPGYRGQRVYIVREAW